MVWPIFDGMRDTRLPLYEARRRPPHGGLARDAARLESRYLGVGSGKVAAVIDLGPGVKEISVDCRDGSGRKVSYDVKPVGMMVLPDGEICLEVDNRTVPAVRHIPFKDIETASLDGVDGRRILGDELLAFFGPEVDRLSLQDEILNGTPHRPARRDPEIKSELLRTDLQIVGRPLPVSLPGKEAGSIPEALQGLGRRLGAFSDTILAQTGRSGVGIAVTMRGTATGARIHIDVPAWAMEKNRGLSGHERIAYRGHDVEIMEAAGELFRHIIAVSTISHESLRVQIVLERGKTAKSISFRLSIDGIWINLKGAPIAAVTRDLLARIDRLDRLGGAALLGPTPKRWLLETSLGTYTISAVSPRAACLRLDGFLDAMDLRILSIGECIPLETLTGLPEADPDDLLL